uniref:Uncharacterized protein n=1 Tax=Tanacetum cinerariifolium TaxID=118510 RepID=A0A6L2KJL9_TANCI|nr:hypothetical protein [Tanacetum cinerariifolium]
MRKRESDTWVWGQTHMVGRGEAYGTVQVRVSVQEFTFLVPGLLSLTFDGFGFDLWAEVPELDSLINGALMILEALGWNTRDLGSIREETRQNIQLFTFVTTILMWSPVVPRKLIFRKFCDEDCKPLVLRSVESMESWCRSSYARAMIELRADVELKDTIVVVVPKLVGDGFLYDCPKKIIFFVVKNLKNPRQAPGGETAKKVDYPVNADSDSKVEKVFNETTSFMVSTSSKVEKYPKGGSDVKNKSILLLCLISIFLVNIGSVCMSHKFEAFGESNGLLDVLITMQHNKHIRSDVKARRDSRQ